jgi:hypothetical protein
MLDLYQALVDWPWQVCGMQEFLFQCPITGDKVQGSVDENSAVAFPFYAAVECSACQRVHLVDPRTSKVVGEDED